MLGDGVGLPSAIKREWLLVLALGGLSALGPLAIDIYLPALPRVAVDMHSSAPAVQLSLTSFLAGSGCGSTGDGPAFRPARPAQADPPGCHRLRAPVRGRRAGSFHPAARGDPLPSGARRLRGCGHRQGRRSRPVRRGRRRPFLLATHAGPGYRPDRSSGPGGTDAALHELARGVHSDGGAGTRGVGHRGLRRTRDPSGRAEESRGVGDGGTQHGRAVA